MDGDPPPQIRRKAAGNSPATDSESPESETGAFAELFRDAYRKCFSAAFAAPLTEPESLRLSVEIEESTGLEIGWKSLKNYSNFLLGRASRVENPSVPTLDTLARYVAGAPRTTEEQRRARERHYPYWVRYKESLRRTERAQPAERANEQSSETREEPPYVRAGHGEDRSAPRNRLSRRGMLATAIVAALVVGTLVLRVAVRQSGALANPFTDEFDDVSDSSLAARGWSPHAVDSAHWMQRAVTPHHLTLFTLQGDNWSQPGQAPVIRNLLVRHVSNECFVVDVRFTSFFPTQNWQQAGILLLEDTAFAGRSARLSIGYNDFSGGFPQTKEVIVQGITSFGRTSDKPEEIVHQRLFTVDSATEPLVQHNLQSSAVRIEKRGTHLRLLYSAGPMKNGPFKEVGATDFDFHPAYVALFAMKGFVSQSSEIPVHVDAYDETELPCAR